MSPPIAYVNIRQHASADVSKRQQTSGHAAYEPAYCIRQHTSAYVSIRQLNVAYESAYSITSGTNTPHMLTYADVY